LIANLTLKWNGEIATGRIDVVLEAEKCFLEFGPREIGESFCGNNGSEMIVDKQDKFCELC